MIKFEISIARRHLFALAAVVVAGALVVPTAGWAADRFDDVPTSNVFHDDIEWLASVSVTKGCNPPMNTEYCPGDHVTRGQMAAFMHRLAASKTVDAATVQGLTPEDLKAPGFPAGAVMYFYLDACPAGWDNFAEAEGRVIVGGTPGTSVGAALESGENRSHHHEWVNLVRTDETAAWGSFDSRGNPVSLVEWDNGIGNEGVGFHGIGLWGPVRDWSLYTDIATTADTMPYLQLLPCMKS